MEKVLLEDMLKRLEKERRPIFGDTWEDAVRVLKEIWPEVVKQYQDDVKREGGW